MPLLSGKKILVTGVLSNRSIAYGIAKAARRERDGVHQPVQGFPAGTQLIEQ